MTSLFSKHIKDNNLIKEVIYEITKNHVRSNLHAQLKYIIDSVPLSFLIELDKILCSKRGSNIVCSEIDFIATKGRYFGYLEQSKLTLLNKLNESSDSEISFGIDFDDIPDLIAKWREEKLNNLGV